MRPFLSSGLSAALWGINSAFAQSNFPPEPIGLTEFFSNRWLGATISYKQTSICETTPGVKAWSGYVGMPWSLLNKIPDVHVDYDINLYFWYFGKLFSSTAIVTTNAICLTPDLGIGGENISLSMDFPTAPAFRKAGYANLVTNSSYNGGVVRQHGNVSFSRVFEAGHSITAYQPETVYQIFQRSMFGKDVATGRKKVNDKYSTKGPISSWGIKNKIPKHSPENQCYTYLATQTCTPEQLQALEVGTAVTKDFIVLKPAGIATSRL